MGRLKMEEIMSKLKSVLSAAAILAMVGGGLAIGASAAFADAPAAPGYTTVVWQMPTVPANTTTATWPQTFVSATPETIKTLNAATPSTCGVAFQVDSYLTANLPDGGLPATLTGSAMDSPWFATPGNTAWGADYKVVINAPCVVPVVCKYDFAPTATTAGMWEDTWGYDFANRNGATPKFNSADLLTMDGAPVPAYMAAASWHWLYVSANKPATHTYQLKDGTQWKVVATFGSGDCPQPNIVWTKSTTPPPPVVIPNSITTSNTVTCGKVTITLHNVSPWIYPVSVWIDGVHSYGPTVDNRTNGGLNGPQKDATLTRTITFPEDSGVHTVTYKVNAGTESDLYKGLPVGALTTLTVQSNCVQDTTTTTPTTTTTVPSTTAVVTPTTTAAVPTTKPVVTTKAVAPVTTKSPNRTQVIAAGPIHKQPPTVQGGVSPLAYTGVDMTPFVWGALALLLIGGSLALVFRKPKLH